MNPYPQNIALLLKFCFPYYINISSPFLIDCLAIATNPLASLLKHHSALWLGYAKFIISANGTIHYTAHPFISIKIDRLAIIAEVAQNEWAGTFYVAFIYYWRYAYHEHITYLVLRVYSLSGLPFRYSSSAWVKNVLKWP